ncbi:MAG TPA: hypothetical protein PKD37_07045 [Oligoflexia bacterium]|nr:hypothetical protein [Oligoflexia bacterium]HMP27719.1 hypothetical protein [Oligoflexia bacterium]
MRKTQGNLGLGSLATFILFVVVGSCVYLGYKIIPIFYNYYELQNQMDQMVRTADVLSNNEILTRIKKIVQEYNIPVKEENITVDRSHDRIILKAAWSDDLAISWKDKEYLLQTFYFEAISEGVLTR